MAPPPKPFRVAIIGGGIGGLFAALCIHHNTKDQPVEIDVYEQASEFKEIGAGVGLAVNAARLVHEIGLGEQLNNISGYRAGIWITFRRGDNGDEIVTIPTDDTQKIRQAPIARSDILDVFRHAVEDRNAATLHTNKKCKRVEDHGDTVTVHFADSTMASAHVVVAADGIHSAVRNQFVDDKPIYSGRIAYRATIPTSELKNWPLKTFSGMWCGKGKHFLTFPIAQNKILNVVAFANTKPEEAEKVAESWTSICDRREVEDDYADFEPTVQNIISLMPDRPSKWRINDREPLPQWHYFGGKVMLLGDSAHAMLPHLGAGAGQALEDGWILSRALGEFVAGTDTENLGSLQDCAQFYQRVRKPRAEKVQATSRIAGNTYNMQAEGMTDLAFEECLPIMAERTRNRMKFVWEVDLNDAYENGKKTTNGEANGIANGAEGNANGVH